MSIKPYYQHQGITIYHGDCREILPELGRFDLLLTDPPYGIKAGAKGKVGGGGIPAFGGKFVPARDYGTHSWDDSPIDQELIDSAVAMCKQAIIWGGNYYAMPPSPSWLVWDKRNGANYFADCELAWSNLGCAVRKIEHLWHGMLRKDNEERFHPTQKPLGVMSWCISLSKTAGSVLDPFMGSGTTLLAAKLHGLTAVGIEMSEKYCEVAAMRLSQDSLFYEEPSVAV